MYRVALRPYCPLHQLATLLLQTSSFSQALTNRKYVLLQVLLIFNYGVPYEFGYLIIMARMVDTARLYEALVQKTTNLKIIIPYFLVMLNLYRNSFKGHLEHFEN